MAEPAGLAIGAIGLAGLFATCVECIDYISLGRNHGRDFELSMTKFMLLKARLGAWGESLQVTQQGNENTTLRDRWLDEQGTVEACLVGIKTLFEESSQIESRYGLEALSADQTTMLSTTVRRSRAFDHIEDRFKSKIQERQMNNSISKKTRWAIHDKKKFDSMIADLAFFIDGLEALSDRLQVLGLQERLLEDQVRAITDTESINMMEVASTQLQTLPSSHTPGNKEPSHTYVGTIIKDRAKVLNGNLGYSSQSSHSYHGTQVSHDAHVVQGDMSDEAARAFFR